MARAHSVAAPVAAVFLTVAPVGDVVIWLWLLMAAETAVLLMLGRDYRQQQAPRFARDAAAGSNTDGGDHHRMKLPQYYRET